jgi:hypothetical protein
MHFKVCAKCELTKVTNSQEHAVMFPFEGKLYFAVFLNGSQGTL